MLFNSYIFVFLFLPLSIIGYFILNKIKRYNLSEWFLVGMSLWFYAYFNISYLPIILISIIGNYFVCKFFKTNVNKTFKKFIFCVALLSNVGVLFYYKYMGFFISNLNMIFETDLVFKNLILPLGISFFTFQQLSYVIDSFKGQVPNYSFRQYSIFVTFFPQLIAGPIVLHNEIIPQLENKENKKFNYHNFGIGIVAFTRGMAKKVLIADLFGNIVNYGFNNISGMGSITAFVVMLSYTIQIYFDFSGYCDMATGIGRMFNINIPMNFNSPYKALTVTEFWKRWHITLTRFLKTYIYFPLGGNRKGLIRTYLNLFIVFFVSGIWHGANYTFIIWGAMHGLFMILERIFKNLYSKVYPIITWIITFAFINVSWIFFRATSVKEAIEFLKELVSFNIVPFSTEFITAMNLKITNFIVLISGGAINTNILNYMPFVLLIAVMIIVIFAKNTNQVISNYKFKIKNAIFYAIVLFFAIISFSGISTFLYFNF